MNKVKKFEISVVDRTYSKVVSDVVKFYSSDSALEVIFILAEKGYEFDSAELVLSNADGSLITRPLTKSPEGYSYEIEKNIISHHGEWKGQVILNSVDNSYVSSKIRFTIEDDLLSERPPKLADIYSWTSLKRYADSLTEELKQAVLSVEGIEDTFNENETVRQTQFSNAEQSRQTTFETNEIERNETFKINETTRQAQELEREKAENNRQTVFDGNEANRTETFNTNEATRQENETTRQQSEQERVSAEAQRKTDHASRSAELDGKADKVVLKNELVNPTFREGLEGWAQSVNDSVLINGNEVTVTTSNNGRFGLYQSYDKEGIKYISAEYYSEDITSSFNLGIEVVNITIPNNTWTRVSSVNSYKGLIRFYADSGLDNHYIIRNPIVINLTQTFGAGNEPTKEEMDELIKVTGYIDGEYALNNKEMLGHLMKGIRDKADKKQEEWITPTLLSGSLNYSGAPIRFYKDEFNRVHLEGRVVSESNATLVAFRLPLGYRADRTLEFSALLGGKPGRISINTDGFVTIYSASALWNAFDGISFRIKEG